jgi:hypothetical protein
MASRTRVTKGRPHGVATSEEEGLRKRRVSPAPRKGKKRNVSPNVVDANVVLQDRDGVNGSTLINEDDLLTVAMCFQMR